MNFLVNSLYELLKIIACCCRYCRMDLFCHFCNCHIHWRVLGFSDFLFRISNVTRLWVQPTECASQNFCDAEAIGFDFDVQKDALAFEMLWPMLWPMLWGFCTFKTWFPSWKFFRIPHLRARHWGALSQVMTDLAVGKDGKPQLTFGQVGCENVKMNMRVVKHRGYSMTDSVFVERQLCGIWVRLCRNCWKPPDERPKSTTCKFLWKISKKPGVTWQMVYRVYSLDRCLPFCMNWRWGKHGKSLQFWNCRNCFGLCLQCSS